MAAPYLLLLHGLGHVGSVWRPFVQRLPPGVDWSAPDLPGHGSAGWRETYTFDDHAAHVGVGIPDDRPVVAVGHSMGGVVALALASHRPLHAVIGFGIKVAWTEQELEASRVLAAKPPKVFASRDEALAAFARFSGLGDAAGVAGDDGIVPHGGGFRLANDPRTMGVGAPDMAALLGAARAPVTLACGELDHMVDLHQLRALVPDAVELPGVGHNFHVTDPGRLWDLVRPQLT